jgi:SPP1 family predicted phage head-tail adaptor
MDYNFVLMMEDAFTVTRKSRVADGTGGYTKSEVPVTMNNAYGRLDDEGYSEVLRVGQDMVYITHRLFTFPGEDIQRDDKVTVKGRTLRVIYIRTEYEDHPMEVLCQEIDP